MKTKIVEVLRGGSGGGGMLLPVYKRDNSVQSRFSNNNVNGVVG
ncbi:Hypothetical protein Cul131001_2118 [Corynebacterium ulcerans]|nr:Hypothetical protein Cul131001_2118 [Corynebacterium ulcerans]